MGQIRSAATCIRSGITATASARKNRATADKQDAIDLLKIREGEIAHGRARHAKIGRLRFEEAAAD